MLLIFEEMVSYRPLETLNRIVGLTIRTGNCLFNALSDQLYGHQKEHSAIRSKVIDYMREHASYYKQFIDVHPGGGIRRNPKRKNAGAYSSPAAIVPPSEADIDRVFEGHLESMARGGTYGDNMEITAFSSAYGVDVKIYQRDFAYMVTGGGPDSPRGVAHIAYHVGRATALLCDLLLTPHSCGSITLLSGTLMALIAGSQKSKYVLCRPRKSRNKRTNSQAHLTSSLGWSTRCPDRSPSWLTSPPSQEH